MSISASLVAILLIIWRQLTKKYIPAKFYYILWATILFRMIVPFSFKSEFSLLNFINSSDQYIYGNSYVVTMEYIDAATINSSAVAQQFNWLSICSVIWITGLAIMAVLWIVFFANISYRLRYSVICKDETVQNVQNDFSVRKGIKVYKTGYLMSPMVLGFINPKIIFSEKSQANEFDFKYALAHEMVHIKRRDHIVKAVAYFALALHWYNPAIWICFYMLNDDIEKSCDEAVVNKYGTDCKKDYATALVNYADYSGSFQFGYISFAKKKVSQRVSDVLSYEKLPWSKIAAFTAVTLFIGFSVTSNPVLTDKYIYVPKTVYLNSVQRMPFENLAEEFSHNVADKDITAITEKSTADTDFFAGIYQNFEQDNIQLQLEEIFFTSAETADVHYKMQNSKNIVFPNGTQQLVAQIGYSSVMGGLYIENLHTYDDYNSFSLVDKSNEAVQIVDKMIKLGLTNGENTPQNAEKITAFCMDMAFDRAGDKNLVFIPAKQVEDIADEFFLIKDCTNLRNTDYFDDAGNVYVYDKNVGTRYEYKIINLEKTEKDAEVTVHFYKDPLQTQLEKIIKYKLEKE